ncbi:MAG: hypothetical protein MR687_05540 [Spirochaetales bacterium]|nr:hypothetical protein [Spirochaetales bacterium]
MKKRVSFSSILTIFTVVLMVVTVLSSCSINDTSPVLINVKIKEDEDSRRLTSTVTGKSAEASSMHYHPEYLGSGNHYPSIGNDEYIEYKEQDGILLSQGLWNIHCSWKNAKGEEILSGSTGPTWINLNTEMIYVRYGTNSLELSYSVISNSIDNPYLSLSIYSFIDGKISTSPLGSYSNLTAGTDSTLIATKTGNKTVYSFSDNAFNESGYYILVIKVKESASSKKVLFTDVIGFVSRFGCSTVLKGSCEVETGISGGGSIYLPDISDPTDPIRGKEGEVIEVTNNGTTSSDGTTQTKLNETKIQDNKVYVILPDKNTENKPTMILGHTKGSTSSTTRIKPPENADFGLNLNGTNVSLTVQNKISLRPSESYYHESSAIIELCPNTSMTLYNNNGKPTGVDAGWAYINGTRRFDANTLLKGGTMNIVGSGASDNISNAKVYFVGSTNENNTIGEHVSAEFSKQGAINIYSGTVKDNNGKNYTSLGGNIILDGNVEVQAVTGISTWETRNINELYDSTIDGALKTNIKIMHGATITATGGNLNGIYPDIATGIYILGNNKKGSIEIVLDNGHINASGSPNTDTSFSTITKEAGIRIDDFDGNIKITLKNGSNISSTNGCGIFLNNCTGEISITVSGSSVTGSPPLLISGERSQNINLVGISE